MEFPHKAQCYFKQLEMTSPVQHWLLSQPIVEVKSKDMLQRRRETKLHLLPPELLSLILGHLQLDDLNRVRHVCKGLKDAVEHQNILRWNLGAKIWQRKTVPLAELRQHLVKKLAQSFLISYDMSKMSRIMMVWAQRLEEEAFLEAVSQEEYSIALTQLIFARYRKLVELGGGHNPKDWKTLSRHHLKSSVR